MKLNISSIRPHVVAHLSSIPPPLFTLARLVLEGSFKFKQGEVYLVPARPHSLSRISVPIVGEGNWPQ